MYLNRLKNLFINSFMLAVSEQYWAVVSCNFAPTTCREVWKRCNV